MFPVRYELSFHILSIRYSVFKGLILNWIRVQLGQDSSDYKSFKLCSYFLSLSLFVCGRNTESLSIKGVVFIVTIIRYIPNLQVSSVYIHNNLTYRWNGLLAARDPSKGTDWNEFRLVRQMWRDVASDEMCYPTEHNYDTFSLMEEG
jgi:hypothetical protein